VTGEDSEEERRRDAVSASRLLSVLGLLVVFLVMGPCTYGLVGINSIDCGGDPDACEPAVNRAAVAGAVGQAVVLVVAVAVVRRLDGKFAWFWIGVISASIIVGLPAYNAARAAVDGQY
jgi:hypothetical protein